MPLSMSQLSDCVENGASISTVIPLIPASGVEGDVVMPPTYADVGHVWYRGVDNGERKQFVVIDEVQSQANRFEEALEAMVAGGEFDIPSIVVAIEPAIRGVSQLSSLSLPHRVADGFIRDSLLDGKPFSKTAVYKDFARCTPTNAAWLLEHSPNHLLFGGWNSTGGDSRGAKFARCISSRIVGIDAEKVGGGANRMAPWQMGKIDVYEAAGKSGDTVDWTCDPALAAMDGKKTKSYKIGDKDKDRSDTSSLNLAMIPSTHDRGASCARIEQISTISMPSLRNLSFSSASKSFPPSGEQAARAFLAAIGLWAIVAHGRNGMTLRSRCDLVRKTPGDIVFSVLGHETIKEFSLGYDEATELLKQAILAVKSAGFALRTTKMTLSPALRDAVVRCIGTEDQAKG
jgi:CRISPR-associated protein Csb1